MATSEDADADGNAAGSDTVVTYSAAPARARRTGAADSRWHTTTPSSITSARCSRAIDGVFEVRPPVVETDGPSSPRAAAVAASPSRASWEQGRSEQDKRGTRGRKRGSASAAPVKIQTAHSRCECEQRGCKSRRNEISFLYYSYEIINDEKMQSHKYPPGWHVRIATLQPAA